MKVTKEQKVFIGLLAVALVALGVDRFVLSPGTAEASDDSASLLIAKSARTATSGAPAGNAILAASSSNPVSEKLIALSDSLHLENAPVKDKFATGSTEKSALTEKPFDQLHELSGVMLSGRHPAAMIDGKLVMVGQLVDGYKLVAVTHGAAVFRLGENQITLRSR